MNAASKIPLSPDCPWKQKIKPEILNLNSNLKFIRILELSSSRKYELVEDFSSLENVE
jgi:hypothetical protein